MSPKMRKQLIRAFYWITVMSIVILSTEGCRVAKTLPVVVTIPGVTEPGAVPCLGGIWEGLEMGRTTQAELRRWIETSPIVHRDSLTDYSRVSAYGIQEHLYRWDLTAGYKRWLTISVISGTVSSVHFPILYPLTLAQVIEPIGEPKYVQAADAYYGAHCIYTVEFDYPHIGLIVIADLLPCDGIQRDRVTGEKTGPLEPDFRVSFIMCSQPGTLEEVIQSIYATSPEAAALGASRRHRWSGFGRVRLFRPSLNPVPTPPVQP